MNNKYKLIIINKELLMKMLGSGFIYFSLGTIPGGAQELQKSDLN